MKSALPKNVASRRPVRCPTCGSTDIADIVYNPPAMTDDLLIRIQAKKAVIRTGAHNPSAPHWHCNYCGYEW